MSALTDSSEQALAGRLQDERSYQVVFVSHCLLNENTRYLGGAFRRGAVAELVDELNDRGVGICQMPCPEQLAWGGVLKRRMLVAYGARSTLLYRFREPLLRLFVLNTRAVYRRLARDVAAQIADYERSGFTVVGIIGVGASPSCGVATTLEIGRSFEAMAESPRDQLDRRAFNRDVVLASRRLGAGIFIQALERQLRRRHLAVPLFEHDLVAEMRGERQQVLDSPLRMTR
jgi:predicted secreted protein